MMRTAAILLVFALACVPALADDDAASELLASGKVRAAVRVTPETPYVGQRTEVSLVLMTSSFFRGAPTWRVPDISGAIVRQESQFAVNASEQIGGQTFATQSWQIVVYPQGLGRVEVPEIEVTMRVANENGEAIDVTTRTSPTAFETRLPLGADRDAFALSAPSFEGRVTLEPRTEGLRVGDALRRTVTLTVEGAPGMLIPPLTPVTLEGTSAYPDAPRVEDRQNRGDLTGTRIESTTYVFERSGRYVIPAMRIPWFDLGAEVQREIVFDEVEVEVVESVDARRAGRPLDANADVLPPGQEPSGQWLLPVAFVLTLLVFGAMAWRRFGPALRARRDARSAAYAESEAGAFGRFEAACRANDPRAAMRTLLGWLDRRASPGAGSLPAFVAGSGDMDLREAVRDLEDRLYGAAGSAAGFSGEPLARAVARARERREHRMDVEAEPVRINPTAGSAGPV